MTTNVAFFYVFHTNDSIHSAISEQAHWMMLCMKCCGQCGFPSEPRGWQRWHDSCFNNDYIPPGTGDLTSAPGGGSGIYFSPPRVTLTGLSWEGKVTPGLSAQPTPHDYQQWKMHLAGVSEGTISFSAECSHHQRCDFPSVGQRRKLIPSQWLP